MNVSSFNHIPQTRVSQNAQKKLSFGEVIAFYSHPQSDHAEVGQEKLIKDAKAQGFEVEVDRSEVAATYPHSENYDPTIQNPKMNIKINDPKGDTDKEKEFFNQLVEDAAKYYYPGLYM